MAHDPERIFIATRVNKGLREDVEDYRKSHRRVPTLSDAINELLRAGIEAERRRRQSKSENQNAA